MTKLRIIFMGTPEFASGILNAILEKGYDVVAVVTAPDRPAGRGQKLKYSAVKEFAVANGITALQPINLKDEKFLAELKSYNANLQVVVAFRMLPRVVWEMPDLGTFNLHASLLPEYRGAAPINWAIINGEAKTGVTTFFIDDKIDTGAMILQHETAIAADENVGMLHDRLMALGSETVICTLALIEKGNVPVTVQPQSSALKPAPKLNKENCRIDWSKPAAEIYNLIRGLSPYPAAWCLIRDGEHEWNIKIYKARKLMVAHSDKAGMVLADKGSVRIAVSDGYIVIEELQFPGKSRMPVKEFLNGFRFAESANAV